MRPKSCSHTDGTVQQVILGNTSQFRWSHHLVVDIWATGCIVAELMLGKPLFKGKE